MVQPGKRFRLDGFYGAILINSTHIPLTIISNNREEIYITPDYILIHVFFYIYKRKRIER